MVDSNLKHLTLFTNSYYKGLPVNSTEDTPCYKEILDKQYREITLLLARYTRVVVVRLDLHPASTKDPSAIEITKFCRSFKEKFKKKYGNNAKTAYLWVREQGRKQYNEGIHWHLWVALKSADNTQPHTQAVQMQEIILNSWEKQAGGKAKRNHMTSWFYLQRNKLSPASRYKEQQAIVESPDRPEGFLFDGKHILTRGGENKGVVLGGVIDECFYALSYVGKVYSKVRTPKFKDAKIFSSSNLNTKDSRDGRQEEIEGNLLKIDKWLSTCLEPMPIEIIRE